MMKRLFEFAFLLLCVMLSSCGSSKKSVTATSSSYKRDDVKESVIRQDDRIVREAMKWIGTPYKYGGCSRSGTDCSGLVMQVYLEVAGIKLPRNSAMQQQFCKKIDKKNLRPGDLVFFSYSKNKVNHVGIYAGDDRIVHASSSKGVIVSKLTDSYYVRTYHSSGRVPGWK